MKMQEIQLKRTDLLLTRFSDSAWNYIENISKYSIA